jgi:hypothetical protein
VISNTIWRTTGNTALSRSGGALVGGKPALIKASDLIKAWALISSASPPQSQTPPTS